MKKRFFVKAVSGIMTLCLVTLSIAIPSKADNPIVRDIYTADPAPMVSGDTLYVYTSHDEDKLVNNFYTMNDWRCYSTKDMVNWTDHGMVMSKNSFKWAQDRAWAPQCIERNNKYYLYVPLHKRNGGMVIGVGVSDSPTGPFVDAIGKPLIEKAGDWNDIDPTVFIDDDGQAYLYFGNPQLRYAKLNEDMISIDKTIGTKGVVDVQMDEDSFGPKVGTDDSRPTSYGEGPWFYKRGKIYYMVYAGFAPTGGSEHIAYSISESPTGPWKYQGIIMPTQGGCYTNHPGVIDYMGHSYFFYHNQKLTGGGSYHRSVAVEEFTYNEDGSFPEINMTTEGPKSIGKLNPYQRVEAETFAKGTKLEIEDCPTGTRNLYSIKTGASIKVGSVDFGDKAPVMFKARMASERNATVELRLDSASGTLIGTLNITNTGGADQFKDLKAHVSSATGVHDLYMTFSGESSVELAKFDYWQFSHEWEPDPTPSPTPVATPTPAPTMTPPPTNPNVTNTQNVTNVTKKEEVKVSKVKSLKVKKAKGKKAKVSWKKVTGAAGYKVLYSTDKKFKKATKNVVTKKTSCTIKKLKKGKKYYVKVAAYKKDSTGKKKYGKYSSVKSIKIK